MYVTVVKTVTYYSSIARKFQIVKIMEIKFEVLACVRIKMGWCSVVWFMGANILVKFGGLILKLVVRLQVPPEHW